MGGNVVNLRKDILPWDPNPIYEYVRDEDGQIILQPFFEKNEPRYVQERSGEIIYDENGDPKMEYLPVYIKKEGEEAELTDKKHYVPLRDGELQFVILADGTQVVKLIQPDVPEYKRMIYSGDKLELRTRMNVWADMSANYNAVGPSTDTTASFWFDYDAGRLFMRSRYFAPRHNSLRITYRYGSQEPVPMAINRLTCLLVAIQIINGSAFSLKFGVGGDVANVKESLIRNWEMEAGRIFSSYQRSGTVHSWSR